MPQHILYLNVKVMRDAGLTAADGKPKVPGSRDELVAMAKQITKGDTFGFSIGTVNPGKYTWGFHNLLWQNGANVYTPDLKRCALAEPAAIEVAEFWGGDPGPAQGRPARQCQLPRRLHRGQARHVDRRLLELHRPARGQGGFRGGPVPRIFKQPIVWTMPHQFTFPKPKSADAAKRDAAWAHMRWMSDHVAEWTLKAGQVSALRKPHADPRITGDPVLRTLLAQAPNWQAGQPTPKWVAAENLTRPVIETSTSAQKPARPRWTIWRARSTPCPTSRRVRRATIGDARSPRTCFLPPGLPSSPPSASTRCSTASASPSPTRASAARRTPSSASPTTAAPRRHPLPREPREHRLLHGGEHAADPRRAARSSPSR